MNGLQERPERHENNPGSVLPSIYDEYSPLTKVLVVKPPGMITVFNDLKVNPIQAQHAEGRQAIEDKPIATAQFRGLISTLEKLGIDLVFSDTQPGRPGHTPLFTRDVGIVIGDRVLPCSMRHDYRQGEVDGIFQNISPKNIVRDDRPYKIEGGDFALLRPDLALVGIGPRTNLLGLEVLRTHFPQVEFVPVYPVREDKAFHIDTVMGIAAHNRILCVPEWIPPEILKILTDRGFDLVEADSGEYMSCCTNILAVGEGIVVAVAENTKTNKRLEEAGIQVIGVELSDIVTSGGGPHCLTLPLVRIY